MKSYFIHRSKKALKSLSGGIKRCRCWRIPCDFDDYWESPQRNLDYGFTGQSNKENRADDIKFILKDRYLEKSKVIWECMDGTVGDSNPPFGNPYHRNANVYHPTCTGDDFGILYNEYVNAVFERDCEGKNPHYVLRKFDGMGQGLVSLKDIQKGTWIGGYAGELKPEKPKDTEYWMEYMPDHKTNLFVDASEWANMMRFVNHSCEPNCRVIYVAKTDQGTFEVPDPGIFAIKKISKDEQITLDYGDNFWKEKMSEGLYCNCKTSACRYSKGSKLAKTARSQPKIDSFFKKLPKKNK